MIYYVAALMAAVCWSLTGIISRKPVGFYNSVRFNRVRLTFVWALIGAVLLISGKSFIINWDYLPIILLSGFVGIYLGDTALFSAYARLGPRRTSIMFATSSPLTVILSLIFLDEALTLQSLSGILIIFFGCVLAIIFGSNKKQPHDWDFSGDKIPAGIMFGFLASLCQASGIIIIKPLMESGLDPIVSNFYRVSITVAALHLVKTKNIFRPTGPHNKEMFLKSCLSGFLGMGVGMTLLMFALKEGEAGIVATLSSITPVMILPLIWMATRRNFPWPAWAGALLVCAGISLLFIQF